LGNFGRVYRAVGIGIQWIGERRSELAALWLPAAQVLAGVERRVTMLIDSHTGAAGRMRRRVSQLDVINLLLKIGRVMFFAVLFFLFYLLAHSMVTHRFFQGGEFGRNGHVTQ
jgi:hypothetical protein